MARGGVNRRVCDMEGSPSGFPFLRHDSERLYLSVSIRTEQLRYRKETLLSDDLAHFKTLRDLRLD